MKSERMAIKANEKPKVWLFFFFKSIYKSNEIYYADSSF